MNETLQGLLLDYIKQNNPGLLNALHKDDALHEWVMDKIGEVELVLSSAKSTEMIEKECMGIMTAGLQPARLRYLRDLFETEFTDVHDRLLQAGLLEYELVNMTAYCGMAFDESPVTEGMDNPQLDYAIASMIHEYLQLEVN